MVKIARSKDDWEKPKETIQERSRLEGLHACYRGLCRACIGSGCQWRRGCNSPPAAPCICRRRHRREEKRTIHPSARFQDHGDMLEQGRHGVWYIDSGGKNRGKAEVLHITASDKTSLVLGNGSKTVGFILNFHEHQMTHMGETRGNRCHVPLEMREENL